eukprot:9237908-Pyramimonas_sp.AAC.1
MARLLCPGLLARVARLPPAHPLWCRTGAKPVVPWKRGAHSGTNPCAALVVSRKCHPCSAPDKTHSRTAR